MTGSIRRRRTGNSFLFRLKHEDGTRKQVSVFIGPCETLRAAEEHFEQEVERAHAAAARLGMRHEGRQRSYRALSTARLRLANVQWARSILEGTTDV